VNHCGRNGVVDSTEITDYEDVVAGPVSILLRHSAHEVQKAALGMVMAATSALRTPPARLEAILPAIISGLVAIAVMSRKRETRLRVQIILDRLSRKCGRDSLESGFPPEQQSCSVLSGSFYSRDQTKRYESKEKRRLRREQMHGTTDTVANEEDSSDDDDIVSYSDSALEKEVLDGEAHGLVVREDRDKVVDLLETRVMDSFMTSDEVAEQSKRALAEQRKARRVGSNAKNSVVIAEDGRPIFAQSDGEEGDGDEGAKFIDGGGYYKNANTGLRNMGSLKRKTGLGKVNQRAKKIKGSSVEEY
jgi:hypothetical protein